MGATAKAKSDLGQRYDSTAEYFREWWTLCERDVVHLSDASNRRVLSKDEANSARTLIGIMAQLEANQAKRGLWYRIKRRTELMGKYFKPDFNKSHTRITGIADDR